MVRSKACWTLMILAEQFGFGERRRRTVSVQQTRPAPSMPAHNLPQCISRIIHCLGLKFFPALDCLMVTSWILGAHSNHSFEGFSKSGNIIPSFAGSSLGSSGVAKASPPSANDLSDSMLICMPLKKLRFTSTPLTGQNLEVLRTSRAYRCLMNTLICTFLAFGPSWQSRMFPTSMPR